MKNRRAILVDDPSIGNEEAIARLGALAGVGEITVLVTPGDVPKLDVETDIDIGDLFLREQHRRADGILEELRRLGLEGTAKVRVGVRPVEIIREAIESRADYVIKVSEGKDSGESTPGSIDSQLLRQCPCPVWITRPRERSPYRRVFVAVDPQEEALGRDSDLDHRLIEWAIEICRADQAELTIMNVWEMAAEGLLVGWGHTPPEEVERLVAKAKEDQEQRVERLLEKHDLSRVKHTLQLIKGQPSEVIPEAIYRGRADLLVMGTVARTGIAGFFIGNTAERVIPQLGCAILAVKPEGFTSPIRVN